MPTHRLPKSPGLTGDRADRSPVRALAVLCTLALAVACGDASDPASPEGTGRYERLALSPVSGTAPARSSIVKTLVPPGEEGEFDAWPYSGLAAAIVVQELPDGQEPSRQVRVTGEEDTWLDVPCGLDAAEFNQVVLRFHAYSRHRVVVKALAGKRVVARALPEVAYKNREPVTLLFDLAGLRRHSGTVDHIRIESEGKWGNFGIESVELVLRPWSRWIPDATEPPALAILGEEGLRSWSLGSDRPLRARARVEAGAELRFACGSPEDLRRPGEELTLTVTVSSTGREAERRSFPVPEVAEEGPLWREIAVPLGAWAGEDVEVGFELETDAATPGYLALGEPALARPMRRPPTVVLITSDTHRADHLGLARHGVGVRTPFLDELAKGGVFFEDCTSSTNVTKPSHISLMTGVYPRDTGVFDNEAYLVEAAPTLAEHFRAAGYQTFASVSTSPLGHRHSGLGQGFDRMSSPVASQRDGSESIEDLLGWMEAAEGVPLFLWLHVFDCHAPYEAWPEYHPLYYPAGKDPRDPALPPLPENVGPRWRPEIRDIEYFVAAYRAEVSHVDELMRGFLSTPRLENATIGLTSDHGESLVEHGVYFSHVELYPQTLKVPLILAGPQVPAGARISAPVHHIDAGRTLLDLAGLESVEFPGQNLLTHLGAEPPRPTPLFSMSAQAYSASVYHGGWFLVLHLRRRPDGALNDVPRFDRHAIQLFHVAEDPAGEVDVVDREPERAKRLRSMLVEWLAEVEVRGWNSPPSRIDEEMAAQLEELGYTSGEETAPTSQWMDPTCECEHCLPWK